MCPSSGMWLVFLLGWLEMPPIVFVAKVSGGMGLESGQKTGPRGAAKWGVGIRMSKANAHFHQLVNMGCFCGWITEGSKDLIVEVVAND